MMAIILEITTSFFSPLVMAPFLVMVLPLTSGLAELVSSARDGAICVGLLPFAVMIAGLNRGGSHPLEAPTEGFTPSPRLRDRSPETVRAAVAALRCR